jgi:hypothetical protein
MAWSSARSIQQTKGLLELNGTIPMNNSMVLWITCILFSVEALATSPAPDEKRSQVLDNKILKYSLNKRGDCAVFQILDTESLKAISTKKMCDFGGRSFWDQVTDSHFYNISFSASGINFYLSITPLHPIQEQIFDCIVPVKKNKLMAIKCRELTTKNPSQQ